jgi:glycosyltransferase involved in cell wall biosynthesis
MNVHVLSNPHRATSPIYDDFDPFAVIVYKYIENLKHKYNFIHYGLEGSKVDCEHYTLPNNVELFNKAASVIIGDRKEPHDLVLCFFGHENKTAIEKYQSELKIIEPVIGYTPHGVFAQFKVFKSYAMMHYYYGMNHRIDNPYWFDAVIPYGEDPNNFEFKTDKQDYFLFFGRVQPEKGLHIAIQATEAAGVKLIIAGPGNPAFHGYGELPSHVEFIGFAGPEKRKELMANAKALIAPTHYLEPFGNMIIEAYLSGTPVITTDWGAFAETVVHGVTGFRCKEFREFVSAIKQIDSIDPNNCYKFAMANYTHDVVYKKHDEYLQKIAATNFYRE